MTNNIDTESKQKYLVLAVVGLLYSVGLAYLFVTLPNQRFTDDLYPRLYASEKLLSEGRDVYDPANAQDLVDRTGWPLSDQLRYYYPAYMLIFTAPLSLLSYETARVVWTILGLWGAWLGTVLVARNVSPPLSVNRLTVIMVLVTISVPALQHTLNAQFNWLGVLGLGLIATGLARKRYFLTGAAAGLLLFKPQATLIPLLFFLIWTALHRERRRFWAGLSLISLIFFGVAELLQPGWLFLFLQSLDRYAPVFSVIDQVWNPYQLVALGLLGLTGWLTVRHRYAPVNSATFSGLLAWAICLNSLIVPLYGMLHIIIFGVVAVLVLHTVTVTAPRCFRSSWWLVAGLFGTGLLAFIATISLQGASGLQITIAELIYKTAIPLSFGGVALYFGLQPDRATQPNRERVSTGATS